MLSLRVVSTVSHQNMQPLLLSKLSVAKQQLVFTRNKNHKNLRHFILTAKTACFCSGKKYFSWILCLFVCLDYLFIYLEKKIKSEKEKREKKNISSRKKKKKIWFEKKNSSR